MRSLVPLVPGIRRSEQPRSNARRALPPGLRLQRPSRAPLWLVAPAVLAAGLLLGAALTEAPPTAVLGTLAVAIAAGAAIYRPALGVAILAFTYPFDLTTYVGPFKLTTSAGLMGVLSLVWIGRQFLRNPPGFRRTRLDVAILLFAAATMLSVLGLGGNYSGQVVGLVKAAGGFLLFFIATQSATEPRDVRLIMGAVVASALLQGGETILPVLTGAQAVSEQARATGTEVNANLFAGYLVLALPLALAFWLQFAQRWALVAGAVSTLVLGMALVATLSRSGWLGMVTALIVLAILLPERRWQVTLVMGGVIAVMLAGGLAGPIANRLAPHQQGPGEMLQARLPIWAAGVSMFAQHPIFGIGLTNFQAYYPTDASRGPVIPMHAHNLFVNVAAERGALGLGSFLFLTVLLFRRAKRVLIAAKPGPERVMIAGLIASFAGFFVHSLFDVSYIDYKILLLFWLLVGLTVALHSRARRTDRRTRVAS